MVRTATWLWILAASAGLLGQEAEATKRAAIIRVDGEIHPQLEQFVYRSLDKAQAAGVNVVVLEIDSPGGYVVSSFQLAERFQQIGWAEVVAYVPREALSGASIAALGCPRIILAEQARFGNAGPIYASGDGAFRHVPEKIRSDLALRMRQLAEFHKRPPTLAEAFVDSELQVFSVRQRNTGEQRYLSQKELDALPDAADWEKGPQVQESGDGRFLEVTGQRAVELKLAEGLAKSRVDLLQQLGANEQPLVLEPGTVDVVVAWLNHPLITGLLFVVGLVALYFELSAPGLGIGGALAALCFSLFFWSRFLGGTAGWLELILFLCGIGFLMIEIFILPGFGIAGIAGICLILVSLVLATLEFVVPHTPQDRDRLATSLGVLVGSGFIFLGCAALITRYFGRLPILNRLILAVPTGELATASDTGEAPRSGAYPVAIGDVGITESPLRPAGKVMFGEAYVDVVADGSFVEPGRAVKVVKTSGNRVVVREIEEKTLPVARSLDS